MALESGLNQDQVDAFVRGLWDDLMDPGVDLDAYEPNDPKRMALDPGFDVDFMRDQWRGK